MGNAKDMEKAIATLNEVKESIINAYAAKTGLSRNRISKLMSDETWINAKKAVELGFADVILFDEKKPEKPAPDEEESDAPDGNKPDEEGGDEKPDEEEKDKKPFKLESDWSYSTRIMGQTILDKITASAETEGTEPTDDGEAPDTPKPPEEGVKNTAPVVEIPNMPVIGMDGKIADGSMPYEILKRQLAFMR